MYTRDPDLLEKETVAPSQKGEKERGDGPLESFSGGNLVEVHRLTLDVV